MHTTHAAVELRGVAAAYGAATVLHEVWARIPARRVTALLGANGSGKSTLLGVVAGVHVPAAGAVERFHTARPALVVQHSAVSDALPVTVRDTVAMGRWARRGPWRPLAARDRAIVASSMRRLGLTALAGRPLGGLSGGQRQRALLAQGLAQHSDLLLLDEPATGLDAATQREIPGILEELRAQGATVVHATHDPEAARRADYRLHLHGGRLVGGDGPDRAPAPDPEAGADAGPEPSAPPDRRTTAHPPARSAAAHP
ncbi:zinc ABC transporter ATP-binding protein AztA [Streptomonospora salina]|uniref:Zinc/manganese transport system ATP-binding protein n=1 Tax=Streptomonospora salina TaxID=104205 RepID=A0A841E0M5_9ACTN|nr:zinc ABC transporter ATP-binding protein AztA [Streptomonospora salina]MBB5996606.1 zinc/manganese transport system ATP-binding protein [Streptomonospora salina]